MTGIREIPSFQTLSRRARMFDPHAINREIAFLHSMEACAAVDSFMIHASIPPQLGENTGGIKGTLNQDGPGPPRGGVMDASVM